jgi:Protein of unknown function (DUF3987)
MTETPTCHSCEMRETRDRETVPPSTNPNGVDSARANVTSLLFRVGVKETLQLVEIIAPSLYQQHPRLQRIRISSDNASWTWPAGDKGGDCVDLCIAFAGEKAPELIADINEVLAESPAGEQQRFRPVGSAGADAEADAFPLDALPPLLQNVAQRLADLHGVPLEFPAAVAMTVTGAAVGRGLRLKTVRGMTTYPNLYLLVGMRSGLGKSTVMKPLFAPFFAYERQLQAEHATRLPEVEAELTIVRKRIGKIVQNGAASDKKELAELNVTEQELLAQQNPPRLVVEDITSPKLALVMQQNRDVVASLSSDARGTGKLLLGRYNESNLDEDIYLKAFSSDSARQDRVGRAGAVLDEPCLAIAWATQPDLFDQLFNNKTVTASGLACRFLPLRINGQIGEPSYDEQSTAADAVTAFDQAVNGLIARYHQARSCLTISAEIKAREMIESYSRETGRRARDGDLAWISSFAARWAEIAWRIALIFHCAEHGSQSHLTAVAEQTAISALRIIKWFAWHQQQLLERGAELSANEKLDAALNYVNGHPSGATAYDVFRKRQALFHDANDARITLDQLEEEGAITGEPSRKSRRFYRRPAPRRS